MKKALLATCAVALSALGLAPNAAAAPIGSGHAMGFGALVQLTDQDVIPPSAQAEVTAPPFGDDSVESLVPIDADPVAVNLTANGIARVHAESDITSELEQASQELAGPFNAQAVGSVEDLEVLLDAVEAEVPLVEADVLRAEAVAVCNAGTVQYSANSEVVNLVIGGSDVPLNGPLTDLIGAISDALEPLVDVITIDQNVVTELEGGGIAVDALVITVLAVAGPPPVATIVVGHAEVGPVTCAAPPGNPGTLTKGGPTSVTQGDSFDYTITVTNVDCAMPTVKITDVIHGPAGSTVTGTSPQADSVTGNPAEGSGTTGGIVVVWNNVGPLAAGQTKVLTITVKTPRDAPEGSRYTDDVKREYTCNGIPGQDTDRIDRPGVELARTGIDMTPGLIGGSALVLAALGFGILRRRSLA